MEKEICNTSKKKNKINFQEFPILDSKTLMYNEFFESFLLPNRACLIKNISLDWESSKLWVKNDAPNFTYLNAKYGNSCVSVQDCSKAYDYNNAKPIKYKFNDYIKYWKDYIDSDYSKSMPLLYLKDWHLKYESQNDNFYNVPIYFAADWLNEYLVDKSLDDYRFVYMGPKGTWSPFHVDVMTSYSWSVNICGQKRWILLPPGEESCLHDNLGNLPQDIDQSLDKIKFFEVFQNPGDAIFVPSNWHHQVWNLKDTISINHNWINGCNIKTVWLALEKNLADVKIEIQDCQDMDNFLDHCQIMLSASFGMNFKKFYEFILHIAIKRIELFKKGANLSDNLSNNQIVFDLNSLRDILVLITQHEDEPKLNYFKEKEPSPVHLLSKVEEVLHK